jgi:hypothetical protein
MLKGAVKGSVVKHYLVEYSDLNLCRPLIILDRKVNNGVKKQ